MDKLIADLEKQIIIPTGTVNGAITFESSDEEIYDEDEEEEYSGQLDQYEQEYVSQEMARYTLGAASSSTAGSKDIDHECMSEVDGVEGYEFRKNPLSVYSSYNFHSDFVRRELPIDDFQNRILDCVEANSVVVIQGPTGCGKTTQVPQYILDRCREKQEYCNIAITQPRKIATINVAKRVCEERGWTLGTVCGYQVGLEKKVSNDVLLTYMTTGVLLQKIIYAKSLRHFTHIIIDEVHERNQDLDFLLLVVRRFLFTNSPETKVILMSATIEAEDFSMYFKTMNQDVVLPAPIIRVDKQSEFKKSYFYLEQLNSITDAIEADIGLFDLDKPEISEGMWQVFVQLIVAINRLDDMDPKTNSKIIGSVLVFLPGINEIEEANQRLVNYFKSADANERVIKWEIIPLHSSLPNDEQARVFRKATQDHRKIILSTNIAESSITVPDTSYVIDFGMTKVMTVDPLTKYMSLKLEWASHVNCDQRAGRVGRTGSGRVYRLVPKNFYDEQMMQRGLPEILRAPLERIVLQSKMLNLNDTPRQILSLALNPPNLKNIDLTILSLKEMGALLQTCRGEFSSSDGDITFLGTVMANLPIDVRLAKFIVLGHMFNCLNESVIIAAGCSVHNIFSVPFLQKFNAYKKLLLWADGSFSDLIALYNLYQVWQGYKRDNHFESVQAEYRWCTLNFVNLKGLREWNLIVQEILQRLETLNIKVMPGQAQLNADEKAFILKIIAAGAFYPNYFIKTPENTQITEREAVKRVDGRNPFGSVFFTGMELEQPVPIYTRAIKEMLGYGKDSTHVSVGFDNSSKVYVEFKNTNSRVDHVTVSSNGRLMVSDAITGKIPKDVYEAIRRRQLNFKFDLAILPSEEAWRFAEKKGVKRMSLMQTTEPVAQNSRKESEMRNCFSEEEFSPVPSLDTEWITVKITEFIDASHFWVNRLESEVHLARLEEILNKTVLHPAVKSGQAIKLNNFYAARYEEDNMFYRCQVTSLAQGFAQVIFIDYGNIQKVQTQHLYNLPDLFECKLPPLAIECVLHGVQPSRKFNPRGLWNDKANDYWRKQTMNILLYGQVHSVVDNVVYVELFRNKHVKSINQHMLVTGQADPAVESFLSKLDHEKRIQVRKADNPNMESNRLSFGNVVNYNDMEMPNIRQSHKIVTLKGPYSPLEMKIYGCIESSINKSVAIEGSSVNTVLLDTEPEDYHNRLLIAGYVSQSASTHSLNLRQTTLMPNVPGLAMLMCSLFCPTMRAKVTEDGTRIASILCGLGYNNNSGRPIYPAHDLVLTLDTELTEAEINKINKIRFYMNQGLKLMEEINQGTSVSDDIIQNQIFLRKELLDLIYAERRTVERVAVKYANHWVKNSTDALVLKPQIINDEEVWPLLWFVKLKQSSKFHPNITKELDDLDRMARNMIPFIEMTCPLCKFAMYNIFEIRMHLSSLKHEVAVNDFYRSLEDSD